MFSQILRVDRLKSDGPEAMALEATVQERDGLAERFGLRGISKLTAALELVQGAKGEVVVTGTLSATVVQSCVVSLEPVETDLDIPVRLRFLPERISASASPAHDFDGEALASEEDEEVETYTEGAFDLGEALAQTLSTQVPEYPRRSDVDWEDRVEGEPDGDMRAGHPFAKLAALKRKGEKDEE